jgi:arylsulfatase
LIPTLVELAQPGTDWQERWPDLKGVSLTGALSGNPSERDERGMLLNYTATLAWDIDFVETLFKGQVRGEFTDAEKAQMGAGQSLDAFACYRGIHDGRYKFARYFKPAEHHQPRDWETLLAHNELELYDTTTDPHEMNNLANQAGNYQALILNLNERLNHLIDTEIGIDDGSFYSRRRNFSLQI